MENNDNYRHEFKYIISDTEMVVLQKRIENLCTSDSNAQNGIYNIRSIYFDDYDNSCFYANEDGLDPREKFRIRIYNCNDSIIKLECKRKERGKTLKTSCSITKEQLDSIIKGEIPKICYENQLLNKLSLQMRTRQLKPIVLVEYDRVPYINTKGNVRITFDMNLCSSNRIDELFNKNNSKRSVMPTGQLLMEVKYDDYIPDEIFRALQIDNLLQTNFSKYYLSRKYSLKGQ